MTVLMVTTESEETNYENLFGFMERNSFCSTRVINFMLLRTSFQVLTHPLLIFNELCFIFHTRMIQISVSECDFTQLIVNLVFLKQRINQ